MIIDYVPTVKQGFGNPSSHHSERIEFFHDFAKQDSQKQQIVQRGAFLFKFALSSGVFFV